MYILHYESKASLPGGGGAVVDKGNNVLCLLVIGMMQGFKWVHYMYMLTYEALKLRCLAGKRGRGGRWRR